MPPLALWFHTFRHLKREQWLAHLPSLRTPSVPAGETMALRHTGGRWQTPVSKRAVRLGERRFRLLNEEREIRGWNDAGIPKLWLYHLHSFQCPPDAALAGRWVADNPPGVGNGWESYPLSLRVISWIQWCLGGTILQPACMHSLYAQAAWLSSHVEYAIQANHLLLNGQALVYAGAFFEGPRADAWLRQGLRIVARELPEQILADGGHYERSPSYHCAVLEGLLDLVNLAPPEAPVEYWRRTAGRMLGWLNRICHPDGRIPFFNDSTFGLASEPEDLRAYAGRLQIATEAVALGDSGFIRLERGETVVLFDAGGISPAYQPAHAHAEALSFELSHRGCRLLVNSGTSTYEAGAERLRQRGTAAHNTIEVDEQDQSEVWGQFRVARRARVFDVSTDHSRFAEAAHDGYCRLSSPVVHRRRVAIAGDGLRIHDTLEGAGTHSVKLHFHVHPDADADVALDPKLKWQAATGTWHPEFNCSIPNRKITGTWTGKLPVAFRTKVVLPP